MDLFGKGSGGIFFLKINICFLMFNLIAGIVATLGPWIAVIMEIYMNLSWVLLFLSITSANILLVNTVNL